MDATVRFHFVSGEGVLWHVRRVDKEVFYLSQNCIPGTDKFDSICKRKICQREDNREKTWLYIAYKPR